MEYRWHRFLTAYVEVLMANKEYLTLIRLVNRYKLIPLEQERLLKTPRINRSIEAMYNLALYYRGDITRNEITQRLKEINLYDKNINLSRE